MKFASHLVTLPVRAILSALCRVDAGELVRIPRKGPLIIVVNHEIGRASCRERV